jgi:hypothetical protein
LKDKNLNYFPILIEYKGYKDKLVKLDSDGQVENRTAKNESNFKNINSFAVNGAAHYANVRLLICVHIYRSVSTLINRLDVPIEHR